MSYIFISYCRENQETVTNLAQDIVSMGHKVWVDRELADPASAMFSFSPWPRDHWILLPADENTNMLPPSASPCCLSSSPTASPLTSCHPSFPKFSTSTTAIRANRRPSPS